MEVQVEPLFAEYSSFTLAIPFWDQVIAWVEETIHPSPPLGEVTVTVALLISFVAAFAASLTRTSACELGVFGTVHENDPAAAPVLAATVDQVEPASVEQSILAFVIPAHVHVMVEAPPAVSNSPPLG